MRETEQNSEAGNRGRGQTGWLQRHPEQPLAHVPDPGTRGDALFQVVLVLLGAFVAQILLVGVGVGLLAGLGVGEESMPVVFYSAQSALGLLAFCLVGAGYLYLREDPTLVGVRRPTGRDVGLMFGGFVALAGMMIGVQFLFDLLGFEIADNVVIQRGEENPELFLLLVPVQFLLTGPGEELLFRGVIQGLLRRAYGVVPGVVTASTLFALFHLPSLVGDTLLPVLAVLFLSGALLGALYEYSRTILVPMVAHALWNATVFGTQYAEAVGALFAA
jgi:membrane protease YdiL (CAAX protease family)